MKTIWVIFIGTAAALGTMLLLFLLFSPFPIEHHEGLPLERVATPAPSVAAASMIPNLPAPPPPPERLPSVGQPGYDVPAGYTPLQYDPAQSFAANLRRLREHCDAWPEITEHAEVLKAFVTELLACATGQFSVVEEALEARGGTNGYRCILLACLMSCDGPEHATADWVWKEALNEEECPGVRRTAAFLASRVTDSTSRPDQLWTLLTDTDNRVVVPALAMASRHMDRRAFEYISTELAEADDIHVRVAAIEAIGMAPYEHEGQTELKKLIGEIETSNKDPLAVASLAKRAAIQHLNIDDPAAGDLLQRIATDPEEEPGVRAKAIGRFSLKDQPAAEPWLTDLLSREIDNPLVVRAVVEVLMTQPSAQRAAFIREQLNRMADAQMREVILYRMGVATGTERL